MTFCSSLRFILLISMAALVNPSTVFAKPEPDVCIALGALAWDDWTSTDGGGSGLPVGEPNVEYLRCKSCHGWDRLGENGGYVRRPRREHQPNAGLGDVVPATRDIAPGMGDYYHVRASGVLHEGTGRSYADGSGSWVVLGLGSTVEDKAAHAAGYTLGNQHPDFSTTGVNGNDIVLTQDQVDCLVDFINFGDADPRFYFGYIDTGANPVWYNLHEGASATAGRSFYQQNCLQCHGEPEQDFQGGNEGKPAGGILAFTRSDGSFSELSHKARWGVPDTVMTRSVIGTPTSQDMIDLMLYLQEEMVSNFYITPGISGTWWSSSRSGEGFLIDVAPTTDGGRVIVVSFYTYDGFGNQVWMVGDATPDRDTAKVPVHMTSGGVFGTLFNAEDVQRADWGELEFQFSTCNFGRVKITPNAEMLAAGMGYESFEYDIARLTLADDCP